MTTELVFPTNEYRYQGTVHKMQSTNFAYYRDQCESKIGLKEEKNDPHIVKPFESLKWLIAYCQQHRMIPVRVREARDLPF